VVVYQSEFRPLKHTLSGNPERTLMKLVVDEPTDRVLACTWSAPTPARSSRAPPSW
jgi:glutathione reductase (NADPH)